MIDSKDISVVIQGPVDWTVFGDTGSGTTLVLSKRLRTLLPGAEIVVSTWVGQHIDGLVHDRAVFSPDPGAQGIWPGFTPNNVNRQIVSTVAGLDAASRPYVLKIRSDMVLEGVDFIREFEGLSPLRGAEDIFSYPIVANNLSSRSTASILQRFPDHPLLFHPSDHISFGFATDVRRLWDVPLQTDKDAFYFVDRTYPNRWRQHELSRLSPEQHILTSALGDHLPERMIDYGYMSDELVERSDYYLRSHFRFIPDRRFPVRFPKYHTDHHFGFEWMRLNSLD